MLTFLIFFEFWPGASVSGGGGGGAAQIIGGGTTGVIG